MSEVKSYQLSPRILPARISMLGIAFLALLTAWLTLRREGVTYALLLVLFFLLTALVRCSFAGLLIVFLWMTSLIHLLKRAIFLLGIHSQFAYYSVLLLPTAIFGLLFLMAMKRLRTAHVPLSGRIILLFGMAASANTLISLPQVPFIARAAAIHDRILPLAMYFVGLAVPASCALFPRASRALTGSAVVSIVYALVQFVGGPTWLDRLWAKATAGYSIQGQKTLMFIEGKVPEWRAYSYYADPLTWGLFLLAAFAVAMILLEVQGGRRRKLQTLLPFLIGGGLFLGLTRTPWVGLLTMVFVYLLLRQGLGQRSWILYSITLAGFAAVVVFGTYLYSRVSPETTPPDSPILRRYFTLGTLEARIGAWESLKEAVPHYRLLGTGYGYSSYYAGRLADIEPGDIGGHNFILELVVHTGLPGMFLFLVFLWALLREGTSCLRRALEKKELIAVRWLLAFVVGYVMTGYLNGGSFMNYYFFFFCGVLAGQFSQMGPAKAAVQ